MSKKTRQSEVAEAQAPEKPASDPLTQRILIGGGIAVLLFAGFITAVAMMQGRSREPIKLPPEEVKPAAAAKPTPAPWTYDSVTNQHWDPTHNHWHTGHPPNQGHAGAPPVSAPDIPNPEPWQYDAATNQHWNPDHNHWHAGQPPADQVAAPAPAVTEEAAAPAPELPPVAIEEAVETPLEPAPAP